MIIIRASQPSDSAAIANLINRAYEVERFIVEEPSTTAESIDQDQQRGTYLVAVAPSGELIGCVLVLPCGFILRLAVEPNLQRQGHGSRLMQAAEQSLHADACDVSYVSILSARSELLGYYERLGYVRTGQTRKLSGDSRPLVPCHLIKMAKNLGRTGNAT